MQRADGTVDNFSFRRTLSSARELELELVGQLRE